MLRVFTESVVSSTLLMGLELNSMDLIPDIRTEHMGVFGPVFKEEPEVYQLFPIILFGLGGGESETNQSLSSTSLEPFANANITSFQQWQTSRSQG